MLPAAYGVSPYEPERGRNMAIKEQIENVPFSWARFLDEFHHARPGITERLLARATASQIGTPYEWLASRIMPLGATGEMPRPILDIGCGSGPMKSALPPEVEYLGIDLSFAELHKARQLDRKHLISANAIRLPLPSDSMGAVISSMAMMLVTPIEKAFDETYRVLKEGGSFTFIRPSAYPLFPRDLVVGGLIALSLGALPAMPQRFSRRRIQGLLETSGFNSVRHENRRFSLSLHTLEDAKLLVDSLYLPSVSRARRDRAAEQLASWASVVREVPISVAMTTAQKSTSYTP
jgi:ubiquinone/menaquinone biosynthesis C-methylase UbiE